MDGYALKNCAASSMGMFSTSATEFAVVLHFESLAVVALAVAFLAVHVHVRQEVHFDFNVPSPWHASQRPPLTLNENRPGP